MHNWHTLQSRLLLWSFSCERLHWKGICPSGPINLCHLDLSHLRSRGRSNPPSRSCGLALSAGFFGGERLPVLPPGEEGPGMGRRMRGHTGIPYCTQRVMDMHSARATTCRCGSGPPCSSPHSAALPPHTSAQHTDTWCKHASRHRGLAYALCSEVRPPGSHPWFHFCKLGQPQQEATPL